ncbi:MAG: hypothetical protein K2W96_00950 [Gemmataceae bacterium]|nr:hypothetical protein [Gemmataceae bacterium]
MNIEDQIAGLERLMQTLMYADEVPNTFGMTGQVASVLQSIGAALGKDTPAGTKKRLDAILGKVEDNRSVFAIPETWLIERVYQQAKAVRSRLGRGPFEE